MRMRSLGANTPKSLFDFSGNPNAARNAIASRATRYRSTRTFGVDAADSHPLFSPKRRLSFS